MRNIKEQYLILLITLIFTNIGCDEKTPINLGNVISIEYKDASIKYDGKGEVFLDKNGLYYIYCWFSDRLSIAVIKDIKNKNYSNLPEEIIIPKTITTPGGNTYNVEIIDINAFRDCKSIKRIKISDKTVIIADSAFYKSSLKEIDFGNSVEEISKMSFYGCDSLKIVVIPKSVRSIDENAFSNCKNLESVTIGNSNQLSMRMPVFSNCPKFITLNYDANKCYLFGTRPCFPNIKSLIIGDNAITIPHGLFTDCVYLTYLKIGACVSNIEDYAFWGCRILEGVHCKANIPPRLGLFTWHTTYYNPIYQWVTYDKNGVEKPTVLYVPFGMTASYMSEKGWDKFYTVIEE